MATLCYQDLIDGLCLARPTSLQSPTPTSSADRNPCHNIIKFSTTDVHVMHILWPPDLPQDQALSFAAKHAERPTHYPLAGWLARSIRCPHSSTDFPSKLDEILVSDPAPPILSSLTSDYSMHGDELQRRLCVADHVTDFAPSLSFSHLCPPLLPSCEVGEVERINPP
jgi:hypothetical protein